MPHINRYTHSVDISSVTIRNGKDFLRDVKNIPYKGYKVEELADGCQVVITKPGGKIDYRSGEKEDFLVWIYNSKANSLWLISHADIYRDLQTKGQNNPQKTIEIIDALERVYRNEDPVDVLAETHLATDLPGESPELLLKVYKWIWAQEDLNYPGGLGRKMSFEGLAKSTGKISKRAFLSIFPELSEELKKAFPRKRNLNVASLIKNFASVKGIDAKLTGFKQGTLLQTGTGITDLRNKLKE